MNMKMKTLIGIVLIAVACTALVTYGLITIQVPVHNHIKILGGTLDLWKRNADETYSTEYTLDDFDGHLPGDVIVSPDLVLVSDSANTVNFVLTFGSTLPASIGTIVWQVEVYWESNPTDYRWVNWTTSKIQCGASTSIYLPGTSSNPLAPGTRLGLRPATPDIGMTGHFRYVLYVSPTAPCTETNFDITITGTQA